jgi:ABC-2 type transport system permease protein
MSGNEAFELVTERGWMRGMGNMLRSGLARWFKTRSWWVNCLIWGGLVGAIVAALVFNPQAPDVGELLMVTLVFTGLFPAVGVIILMQDAIVGEKREGTAAWVLSKPVTRQSLILSKVIANSLGVLLTMVIVPCAVGFAIIASAHPSMLVTFGVLGAMGVIFISQFFFLSLTLMLGTFFDVRAPVVGIPLAILFLQQNLINVVPNLRFILPWNLVIPLGNANPLTFSLLQGTTPSSEHLTMLVIIIIESILFTLVALWRFNRQEF